MSNDPEGIKKSEVALKLTNPVPRDAEWLNDSVASQHMTPYKRSIPNYSTFESTLRVKFPDDICIYCILMEKGVYIFVVLK